jgi:hypothetical protein
MSDVDMVVLAALAGFAWWTYVFLPLVYFQPEDGLFGGCRPGQVSETNAIRDPSTIERCCARTG